MNNNQSLESSLKPSNKLLTLPMTLKSQSSSPKKDFLLTHDYQLRIQEFEEEKENELDDIDVVNPLV